jgi:hypothetical protein
MIYTTFLGGKWKQFTSIQTLNEPTIVKDHSSGSEVVSRNVLLQYLVDIWVNKIVKRCTYILLLNELVGNNEEV